MYTPKSRFQTTKTMYKSWSRVMFEHGFYLKILKTGRGLFTWCYAAKHCGPVLLRNDIWRSILQADAILNNDIQRMKYYYFNDFPEFWVQFRLESGKMQAHVQTTSSGTRQMLMHKKTYMIPIADQCRAKVTYIYIYIYEPHHEKTCLVAYANNKSADQPACPRSLISAFVIRYLDSLNTEYLSCCIHKAKLLSSLGQKYNIFCFPLNGPTQKMFFMIWKLIFFIHQNLYLLIRGLFFITFFYFSVQFYCKILN